MDHLFLPENHAKYKAMMPARGELVLLQLAEGLQYIHSKLIVHRDIKPHNVLFKIGNGNNNNNCKVTMKWTDFGLSKPVSEEGDFSMSTTGGRTGTHCWIAPEVLESNESNSISFKCDIWSAGCVFYYYLTEGKHPFGNLNEVIEIPSNAKKGDPIHLKRKLHLHICKHTGIYKGMFYWFSILLLFL